MFKTSFNSLASHNGIGERLVDASRHLGDVLRDAGTSVTRGAGHARDFGDEMLANSRDVARSARTLVEQRPMEAMLIAGLAAFALGWLLRRVQEPASGTSAREAHSARRADAHSYLILVARCSAGRRFTRRGNIFAGSHALVLSMCAPMPCSALEATLHGPARWHSHCR